MTVNGDQQTPPGPLPGIEAVHGPVVFQVRLFADGHLDWKAPNSADPAMNEILFRGYFDKVRHTILRHLEGQGQRIVTPS